MIARVHFLQFTLIIDLIFSVNLDIVEGEEIVVLFDSGHWLLGIDILK